jgi:hypothetical protein
MIDREHGMDGGTADGELNNSSRREETGGQTALPCSSDDGR